MKYPGRLRTACALLPLLLCGCATFHHQNTAPFVTDDVRGSEERLFKIVFKTYILYPARDVLAGVWLGPRLFGGEAWNADHDWTTATSFWTPRSDNELTPAAVAIGPCTAPPVPPFVIDKPKKDGATPGFRGHDATGRKFLFKLDDPAHPELGTSAAVVSSRLLWALGYRVPAEHLVTIAGTGDARYDGRRATATEYLDSAVGHWRFDWFRNRRETRALRLACAWVNDTDRGGQNNLVVMHDGHALYYMIDFNSCLGSWQGRPKELWRGWRYAGDPGWCLLTCLTLGLAHAEPQPPAPVHSPAVGRFDERLDPLRWRSQEPNTAFDRMTPADARWVAAHIRRLERPHIEALVSAAHLSNPADAAYLVDTLLARRARILEQADR